LVWRPRTCTCSRIVVPTIRSWSSTFTWRTSLLEVHAKCYGIEGEERVVRRLLVADPDGYLVRPSEAQNG